MGRGRAPCCEKVGLNKGSWTPVEDLRLISYIRKHGHGNWRALPKLAGLLRCGKSCRLRWINYLRPDIKRGNFTKEEEDTIIKLHKLLGNKWSKIASCLPGRTDNEIKNMWNTHLKKRLASEEQKSMMTAKPEDSQSSSSSSTYHSCSDHGESKSSDEEKSTPRLDFTDLSIEMIEIPIEPGMDMWSVQMDDIEGKIISEMHMDALGSKVSPCSSSSELFEMNGIMGGTDQGEAMKDPSLIPDTVMELGFLNLIQGGGYGSLSAGEEGAMEELTQRNSAELLQEEEAEGEEGKSSEWLEYLEKELGLCGASEDNQESLMRDVADQMDPVSSYFQRDLNSTSPLDPHQLRVS